MIQFFMSVLTTLICSASFALYQQTHQEVRGNETWVTITMDTSHTGTKADVLFVIDDSGSMGTHQKNLSIQAGLIAQELSFYSDINAGVITTTKMSSWSGPTKGSGQLVGPVLNTTTSPDFVGALSKQMLVGTNGDATEVFFDNILLATTEPLLSTVNAGFIRPNADLLLVILTDTEDKSKTTTAAALQKHLELLKPYNLTSVISVTPANTQTCDGESELASYTGIKDFVSLMGGQTVDLCGNFAKEFPQVIGEVKIKLHEIALNAFPGTQIDYSTLTVKADGNLLPIGNTVNGWVYDTNKSKVILGSAVISNENLQKISVSYKLIK